MSEPRSQSWGLDWLGRNPAYQIVTLAVFGLASYFSKVSYQQGDVSLPMIAILFAAPICLAVRAARDHIAPFFYIASSLSVLAPSAPPVSLALFAVFAYLTLRLPIAPAIREVATKPLSELDA